MSTETVWRQGAAATQKSHNIFHSESDCSSLFGSDDNHSATGEIALWRAVITQALMDAGSESRKSEHKYEKAQAIAWLNSRNKDYYFVCEMADMDPEYVREQSIKAIKNGCKWRNEDPNRTSCNVRNKGVITPAKKQLPGPKKMLKNEGKSSCGLPHKKLLKVV